MNSNSILFFSFMILGIMMSLCSSNLITVWIGLEISLMCFIPMISGEGLLGSESSMKYFIIQSLSSLLLLFGMMMLVMSLMNLSKLVIIISLLVKLGVAPFHMWVLSVVEGLNYFCMFIMLFLMKFVPLFLMSMMNSEFMLLSLISMLIGSISGLIQNSIRKLLAFSSIYNLGVIITCINNNSLWLIYFVIYGFILFCLLFVINGLNSKYVNQIIMSEYNMAKKLIFWFMILSMGGLPPLLGFVNKLVIIEFLLLTNNFILLISLISTALLVLFFYMRISYISMMFFSLMLKWNLIKPNNISLIFVLMNLSSFPVFLLIKSLA
uniref:NADH dehydrogenase subunit 2 n=1 Tax=Carinata recurvata TaxID=3110982 RepID=UPI002E7831EA|nr:NADH dehydrogenase subunit 2 [Carinata recurvata]WRH31296.1 NADH dehydrogenase subunit 2 [Carinata recurvata]